MSKRNILILVSSSDGHEYYKTFGLWTTAQGPQLIAFERARPAQTLRVWKFGDDSPTLSEEEWVVVIDERQQPTAKIIQTLLKKGEWTIFVRTGHNHIPTEKDWEEHWRHDEWHKKLSISRHKCVWYSFYQHNLDKYGINRDMLAFAQSVRDLVRGSEVTGYLNQLMKRHYLEHN